MDTKRTTLRDLLEDEKVREELDIVRQMNLKDKPVSDVWDESGTYQFVDLVMEGGGVLGIALAGYTYCLEEANIRFLSIAGTSAGAINALLLASAGGALDRRAARIVELLVDMELDSFQDGNWFSRRLITMARGGSPAVIKWLCCGALGIAALPGFRRHLGLNPGIAFEKWLEEKMVLFGTPTERALLEKMKPPKLQIRRPSGNIYADESRGEISPRLALFTSEVTTRSKVELPLMAELYWTDHADMNPALYARASMSVPFFFYPLAVENVPTLPDEGEEQSLRRRWTGYAGETAPKQVKFLDGGIMSNFPIYAFHDYDHVPRMPTFGARLGLDRHQENPTEKLFQLVVAAFRSTQHILDYDFIVRNPEYNKLIARIKTDGYDWLNFSLKADEKIGLFRNGVIEARKFLQRFNWEEYKSSRDTMRKMARASGTGDRVR